MSKLAGRHVAMFRCMYDPSIGPKPRNAFMPKDFGGSAIVSDYESGLIVTTQDGSEHFVPFTNIQTTRLEPLTVQQRIQLETLPPVRIEPLDHHPEPPEQIKRRPGRPVGS